MSPKAPCSERLELNLFQVPKCFFTPPAFVTRTALPSNPLPTMAKKTKALHHTMSARLFQPLVGFGSVDLSESGEGNTLHGVPCCHEVGMEESHLTCFLTGHILWQAGRVSTVCKAR